MPTIRTAARALIFRDDRLLVVCYRDAVGEWFVTPGGGQAHGEDLVATLQREVLEETGYPVRVGPLRFVRECMAMRGERPNLPADFHQVECFFECQIDADAPPREACEMDAGQAGCEWVDLDDLARRRFYPRGLIAALRNGSETAYLGWCD